MDKDYCQTSALRTRQTEREKKRYLLHVLIFFFFFFFPSLVGLLEDQQAT